MNSFFDVARYCPSMTIEDYERARSIVGVTRDSFMPIPQFVIRAPDLDIRPDGKPYLFRWYVIPKSPVANVYFHIQVASDPERPLHDHPWDNCSVILSGGYDETWMRPSDGRRVPRWGTRHLRKGDSVRREAIEAHRLILPPDIPYTMTLFTTGPEVREWGYWYPDGWHDRRQHNRVANGVSVHQEGQ